MCQGRVQVKHDDAGRSKKAKSQHLKCQKINTRCLVCVTHQDRGQYDITAWYFAVDISNRHFLQVRDN